MSKMKPGGLELITTNYDNKPYLWNIAGFIFTRTYALGVRFDM